MCLTNNQLMKLSTYITIIGVLAIILAKTYGWFLTNSVTILASLVDSLLDICVSAMNMLTVHYALQPPDREHRFGHEKAEDIAVFCESIFFALSGCFVIYSALSRFFNLEEALVRATNEGVIVLLFSIVVTLIIVLFQFYVIKRSNSSIIKADSIHYISDFLTNIAAIIGIILAQHLDLPILDSIMAIMIAFYIIYNAIKMFNRAFKNLMDHELDEKDRQIIIEILKNNKKTQGFHDLKTRYAGNKPFIQFHLEFENTLTIMEVHEISEEVEHQILSKIPNAEIFIHQDPADGQEEIVYTDV